MPDEIGLDFETVTLTAADGVKLDAWFIPAKGSRYTVLFCHGNAGNITHRLDSINIFNELGLNCLIFDYRGYGNSEGYPSEQGTYLDAQAAYEWLTQNRKIRSEHIIVFGRSLGASVAAKLASMYTTGGLVLESSFTSYIDIGRKFYPYMPVKWFAKYDYNTIQYVRKVSCPVMVIHSRNDEIVPFEFGLQLYEAAKEPKEFVEIFGGHNDGFLVSGQIYKEGWRKWLERLESLQIHGSAGRQRLSIRAIAAKSELSY
jgi:fermentation-respiration switch protein FrsA (DUF1100 family)